MTHSELYNNKIFINNNIYQKTENDILLKDLYSVIYNQKFIFSKRFSSSYINTPSVVGDNFLIVNGDFRQLASVGDKLTIFLSPSNMVDNITNITYNGTTTTFDFNNLILNNGTFSFQIEPAFVNSKIILEKTLDLGYTLESISKDGSCSYEEAYYYQILINYLIVFSNIVELYTSNNTIKKEDLVNLISDFKLVCIRNNMVCKYNAGSVFDNFISKIKIGINSDVIIIVDNEDGFILKGTGLTLT